MKKLLTLLLAVTCVCGCSQTKNPTNESKTARIPMVMVDGELYLDTGYDSTIEGRCGVMVIFMKSTNVISRKIDFSVLAAILVRKVVVFIIF